MYRVDLPRLGTFDVWRDAARRLAAHDVPPDRIEWQMEDAEVSLFSADDPLPDGYPRNVTVPKAFPALAKQLCASRAAGSFDLAYRLLLRVNDTPHLLTNRADAEVDRAEGLAKNIRRDMHKMKAFVRFREATPEGSNRRKFISWFEPDHRIEELIAGFFTRRFGDMDWVIVTPEVTTQFENGELTQQAIARDRLDLSDETEELWKTYYANIFNPARLKVKAMQSEMPKKYWKNLPEAALIPGLIAEAEAKVRVMQATAPTLPPVRAQRVLDRLQMAVPQIAKGTFDEMRHALKGCARCPLAGPATQVVPGEGPEQADLMIVGEQPGDREDLEGRPFVGPAGQMFDRLAQEAGLDRQAAYVTNAVKHFKFQVRGKRRIHASPSSDEISHCRWWLSKEIALVQPKMIVALGATAARALTGNGKGILKRAGTIEQGLDGVPVYVTLHPSALLRPPDKAVGAAQTDAVRGHLAEVASMMAQAA
ncbi:Uracil-DNA glycosylase [Sulfitobacter noctilucicola]|uniref:Type-4 uracil-DNA glycosylase n=1 Tax=Sulfitobacter noctilucicola TaxID=1342301 RepID=A0A7W6Q4X1_9RHOB|nr:UdgX family uracil-DNA binding protein [Sulfitobacter noctilucicola]KIN63379.1 Uracil-DNA glycosylase [Sulfitobacter noctilucicola]MBB4175103.1 DNA polymerase [Sulfitobacter noctilucicola]